MYDAVSALEGVNFTGLVQVQEAGLRGMLTLRGDLGSLKLKNAVKKLTGVVVPDIGGINLKNDKGVAWMSPDELLILLPYNQARTAIATLSKTLNKTHHLAVNVSDARAVFTLSGVQARDVLAKLTPADMSQQGFEPGQIRRSRIAQVPAAFWQSADQEITLVCFRSVAGYVFDFLKNAANTDSRVDYF